MGCPLDNVQVSRQAPGGSPAPDQVGGNLQVLSFSSSFLGGHHNHTLSSHTPAPRLGTPWLLQGNPKTGCTYVGAHVYHMDTLTVLTQARGPYSWHIPAAAVL
jgi:hypothetical protein